MESDLEGNLGVKRLRKEHSREKIKFLNFKRKAGHDIHFSFRTFE